MEPLWLLFVLTVSVCAEQFQPQDNSSLPDDRIVGGKEISIKDIPYQVAVELFGSFFCGGCILTKDFVVTAAHCTNEVSSFNDHYLSVRSGSDLHFSGGQVKNVEKVYQHYYYDPATMDNDISILKLQGSLDIGIGTAPIKLPPPNTKWHENQSVLVSGWGLTEEGGTASQKLQGVTVQVISRAHCEAVYSITSGMFCAGMPNGGKDSCQGDSGGPAVINNFLAGIVSWGSGCARPHKPGVYTNVVAHLDFINEVLHSQ